LKREKLVERMETSNSKLINKLECMIGENEEKNGKNKDIVIQWVFDYL